MNSGATVSPEGRKSVHGYVPTIHWEPAQAAEQAQHSEEVAKKHIGGVEDVNVVHSTKHENESKILDFNVCLKVRANIISISEVDTVEQTFSAHLFIEAKWENAHCKDDEWNPRLHFKNEVKVDDTETRSASSERKDEHGNSYSPCRYDNSYKYRFRGVFADEFDLHHFPFDVQTLNFKLSSYRPFPATNNTKWRKTQTGVILTAQAMCYMFQ